MEKAVAYFRVSTQKQGYSGLGLEAQEHSVTQYAQSRGLDIVARYTELESGTGKRRRTEIYRAIAQAKAEGAVLLIAKLDRLSRNLHFVTGLLESQVDFIAVDIPEANRLTIQLMAVLAEHEARATSARTKEALAAAKRRGVRLGSPQPMTEEVRALGRATQQEAARDAYTNVSDYIALMRDKEMSLRAIARKLTESGFKTRTGKEWNAVQVSRVLSRARATLPEVNATIHYH